MFFFQRKEEAVRLGFQVSDFKIQMHFHSVSLFIE